MRYLLDTSVVVRRPDLLARKGARDAFALPVAVIKELSGRSGDSAPARLREVLEAAANSGVELFDTPEQMPSGLVLDGYAKRLSSVDLDILGTLFQKSRQGQALTLITDDSALRHTAEANGLLAMTLRDYLKSNQAREDKGQAQTDNSVAQKVKIYDREQAVWIANASAFSLAGILTLKLATLYFSQIVAFIAATPQWQVIIFALVAGALLYTFRQRKRSSYGAVEVAIGLAAVAHSMPTISALGVNLPTTTLQLATGLYIVVRGLDNIGVGLTNAQSRYAPLWKRIFG